MYPIPAHIKLHVDRIIREFEILYHRGHKVALQMFRDNRIYSGVETTEYCLRSVREFRELLDTQADDIFTGTEDEVRRNIYEKICEFYSPLSEEAILRITQTTYTQDQLERALHSLRKHPSTAADATNLSHFISNGRINNWCDLDKEVKHKIFKLVQTEKDFEKLLQQQKYPTTEITHSGTFPYSKFRIAFQFIDIESGYRKQNRVRVYRNFWNTAHDVESFDTDYKIFNMWNDITETGIYYVYIPQN